MAVGSSLIFQEMETRSFKVGMGVNSIKRQIHRTSSGSCWNSANTKYSIPTYYGLRNKLLRWQEFSVH